MHQSEREVSKLGALLENVRLATQDGSLRYERTVEVLLGLLAERRHSERRLRPVNNACKQGKWSHSPLYRSVLEWLLRRYRDFEKVRAKQFHATLRLSFVIDVPKESKIWTVLQRDGVVYRNREERRHIFIIDHTRARQIAAERSWST